jgi:hypothetical protein
MASSVPQPVYGPHCNLLVWHGNVAASAGLRDSAKEGGERLGAATQRHVPGIDARSVERGVLKDWRKRVLDGVAKQSEKA